MNDVNWNEIGLRRNPFAVVPDKESADLIWAGFSSNKSKFDAILTRCLNSTDSKVILNISRYGGGKTHSAFYYSNSSNLPLPNGVTPPLNLIIVAPKTGEDAPREFFLKLIESIGLTYISDTVKVFRHSSSNENEALKSLQDWAKSEDLGRIIWLLGDANNDISFGAEQLLLGGNATNVLKNKLRIRRGMSGISDISQVLAAIIRLVSKYTNAEVLVNARRVFIWIDELESLVYYTSKQYRPFTQSLREMIDNSPQSLVLIMNFSFAEPTDVDNLEIIIGEALLDRVTDTYIFEEATIEEAEEYVKQLFLHFRTENYIGSEYYPFSENSLKKLLQKAPSTTEKPLLPRTINRWCNLAIIEAKKQNLLPSEIDEAFIENISFVSELDN